LKALPQTRIDDLREANMIILTGGEPMLYPEKLMYAIIGVRLYTSAPIYVYTAKVDNLAAMRVLMMADGMTLTLHTQGDVEPFLAFAEQVRFIKGKSLRLNVIEGIDLTSEPEGWIIKKNIKWRDDGECPLPPNERFMRL
jgi:organic radical activating enzyme